MAITNLLTSLENFDGTPTFVSNNTRYGGGAGASQNSDIIRQGTNSAGRRADNVNPGGFGVSLASTDLSGAGEHVKAWVFITQWAQLNQLNLIIASGSTAGAGDVHTVPSGEWPVNGGFIPVWVDVSRTADSGGPATESAINEVGVQVNIGNVGGNASNVIMDEIHHGTSGLRWTGASGDIDEFRTYEDTNDVGVLLSINGVDFCYARMEIGDSGGTLTNFTDSGFTLVFPDQSLVADTFMGITVEMQNASSTLTLSNATIQSANVPAATKRPDFLINGTSGTVNFNTLNLLGMRLIQLTSVVDYNGGTIEALELTQASAEIQNATIRPNTASGVAMIDDATFGASGIHDCDVVQAGSGHFVEITSPGSYDWNDIIDSGFGGTRGSNLTANSGANDAMVYNNSGGAVTINVNGGTSPSVRNGAGATTTVATSVPVKVTVRDFDTDALLEGVSVYLITTGATVVLNGVTDVNGEISGSFAGTTPADIDTDSSGVKAGSRSKPYEYYVLGGQISASGYDVTALLQED